MQNSQIVSRCNCKFTVENLCENKLKLMFTRDKNDVFHEHKEINFNIRREYIKIVEIEFYKICSNSFTKFLNIFENLLEAKLRHNNLNENDVKQIDCPHLTVLDLCYNNIQVIENDTFKKLAKLKCLELENNPIKMIKKGAFDNFMDLEVVNLSYMHTNLEKNSKIEVIEESAFNNLPKLELKLTLPNTLLTDAFTIEGFLDAMNYSK